MKFCFVKKNEENVDKIAIILMGDLLKKGYVYDEFSPELVISIGGDGTFLNAIQNYYELDPLFVSINYGNLGYLCEYKSDEVEDFINDLTNEKLHEKCVSLLRAKFNNNDYYALNEFRVESIDGHTVIFDVYINDTYLETLKADGCCISSSIGSSGLAKSLGGALVDNEIEMIEFVEKSPIMNRTYNSIRSPFVLQKDKIISIKNIKNARIAAFFDNRSIILNEYKGDFVFKLGNKKIRILKNVRNNYIRKTHEAFIDD